MSGDLGTVVSFDNLHPIARSSFRRRITVLDTPRMADAYRRLRDATGC